MALVLPPTAAWTVTAFSKASRVRMSRLRMPRRTSSRICFPAVRAMRVSSVLVTGISAEPGRASPSASAMACMVLAVANCWQAPGPGQAPAQMSAYRSGAIFPASSSRRRSHMVSHAL